MIRAHIFIVILAVLLSGCGAGLFSSNRLPEERSTTTGVLVVATEATNRTSERFAYYYAFISDARPDLRVNVRLFETRKVAVISGLAPGNYTLTGVRIVSEPNSKIDTFVAPDTRQMNHPISFTIKPGSITVLDYGVVASQEYLDGFRSEELWQDVQVKKLGAGGRSMAVQELGRQGNLGAWTMVAADGSSDQLPEVVYTNSSKAFIHNFIRRIND